MDDRIVEIATGIVLGISYPMGILVVAMAALHSVSRVVVRVAVIERPRRRS